MGTGTPAIAGDRLLICTSVRSYCLRNGAGSGLAEDRPGVCQLSILSRLEPGEGNGLGEALVQAGESLGFVAAAIAFDAHA